MAIFVSGLALFMCVLIADSLAKVRQSLLLKQTHNDLKWIVAALHDYYKAHGSFPPVVVRDENGSPIHSWRSIIQDHFKNIVETDDRFNAYDLTQPWNSPVNVESGSQHRFGSHPYRILAVVGPHAAWNPVEERSISDFADGAHETLLLIAVRNSDCAWHEPVDAVVTDSGTLELKNEQLDLSSDVFLVMADGSVRYAANGLPAETLATLLTIDAGDTVNDW
ncbi:hypothetical protein AB1L42_16065 [Thalassoglobus sp. JC818]|uniref:hypothetical protein n=1 Tax=Thalassoglobus sp. JC818 TaxID=3232136 RepID=UPI00345B3621